MNFLRYASKSGETNRFCSKEKLQRFLHTRLRNSCKHSMVNDFDAHKVISEAHERHEHAAAQGGRHEGRMRLVPIMAALLAVAAAIATLLSNQRATAALAAKNDAIFLRTEASDSYNFYLPRSIKQHLYTNTLTVNASS